jgi:hypothetical protein
MAKKNKVEGISARQVRNHQHPIWRNFDQCWATCVKNGNSLLKESARAHLKAIGKWEDQKDWISGLEHFGIPVEK